jgi:hypothetical protein
MPGYATSIMSPRRAEQAPEEPNIWYREVRSLGHTSNGYYGLGVVLSSTKPHNQGHEPQLRIASSHRKSKHRYRLLYTSVAFNFPTTERTEKIVAAFLQQQSLLPYDDILCCYGIGIRR